MMITIITVVHAVISKNSVEIKMMISIVRGGREGVREFLYDRNYHK